jgi:uncharacterized protein
VKVKRIVTTDGRVVCERCVIADRPLRRMRGLLGRKRLDVGEGILLRPAASVHTFFMRFPIDVVFLDRELSVLAVEANVPPWRTRGRRGAKAALELAAGGAGGVAVGDELDLEQLVTPAEDAL